MNSEIPYFGSQTLDVEVISSESEKWTAQNVLEILETAWMNEKFSPEILPHKMDFIDCMMEQIKCMECNIRCLPKGDTKVDIHKIELERIRYLVTNYLRCRVKKIERFAAHVLEHEANRGPDERYLSDSEVKFAFEYIQHLNGHFQSVIKEMPYNLQTSCDNDGSIKPNIDSYVFLKTNRAVSSIIVKDVFENREEEITLSDNTQHLLPYISVSESVKNGEVQLI